MKVLLQWNTNWADEMDIYGFKIVEETEYEDWKQHNSQIKSAFNVCVGTNEEIDYNNGQELVDEVSVKPLTEEDEIFLGKLFPFAFSRGGYGHTSFFQKFRGRR